MPPSAKVGALATPRSFRLNVCLTVCPDFPIVQKRRFRLYTVSPKSSDAWLNCYNFDKHEPILITFGNNDTETATAIRQCGNTTKVTEWWKQDFGRWRVVLYM